MSPGPTYLTPREIRFLDHNGPRIFFGANCLVGLATSIVTLGWISIKNFRLLFGSRLCRVGIGSSTFWLNPILSYWVNDFCSSKILPVFFIILFKVYYSLFYLFIYLFFSSLSLLRVQYLVWRWKLGLIFLLNYDYIFFFFCNCQFGWIIEYSPDRLSMRPSTSPDNLLAISTCFSDEPSPS